jgi:hypothetical protein
MATSFRFYVCAVATLLAWSLDEASASACRGFSAMTRRIA